MSKKRLSEIISEIELQFPDGFESKGKTEVENTCRTCMFLGQFAAPKDMNVILTRLKDKFPNGFDKEQNNTYDVANEFLSILKNYVNEDLSDK